MKYIIALTFGLFAFVGVASADTQSETGTAQVTNTATENTSSGTSGQVTSVPAVTAKVIAPGQEVKAIEMRIKELNKEMEARIKAIREEYRVKIEALKKEARVQMELAKKKKTEAKAVLKTKKEAERKTKPALTP